MYDILLYGSFATDEKPFPFKGWYKKDDIRREEANISIVKESNPVEPVVAKTEVAEPAEAESEDQESEELDSGESRADSA